MGQDDPLAPDLDDELALRRAKLEKELAKRVIRSDDGPRKSSGWAEATKIASEFVAGIVVGVGLGLIFDRVFGTSPLGLVVFLVLGFAAGVLNVLRTQGVVADAGAKLRSERSKPVGEDAKSETRKRTD